MDRRDFLKKLGIGAAVAATACAVPEFATSAIESLLPSASAIESLLPSASVTAASATFGTYANYCNFSSFASAQVDEMVGDCAAELGYRAGLSVRALQMATIDC